MIPTQATRTLFSRLGRSVTTMTTLGKDVTEEPCSSLFSELALEVCLSNNIAQIQIMRGGVCPTCQQEQQCDCGSIIYITRTQIRPQSLLLRSCGSCVPLSLSHSPSCILAQLHKQSDFSIHLNSHVSWPIHPPPPKERNRRNTAPTLAPSLEYDHPRTTLPHETRIDATLRA